MHSTGEIYNPQIILLMKKLHPPFYPKGENLSAVLVLLIEAEDKLYIILTLRKKNLKRHGGEISFPGGEREGEEDPASTALREAKEEIGIVPEEVNVIGALSPTKTLTSNFLIIPIVGVLKREPAFRKSKEVEKIIKFPLYPSSWWYREKPVIGPVFFYREYYIWGATARILKELLEKMEILRKNHNF